MGLFSFVKKQFIDIIQWTESEPGVFGLPLRAATFRGFQGSGNSRAGY